MTPRALAMSPAGRFVALRRVGAVDVVDVQGISPRRSFGAAATDDFAIAGTNLWISDPRGIRIESLDTARPTRVLADEHGAMRAFAGRTADAVLVGTAIVTDNLEILARNQSRARWVPLSGRTIAAVGAAGSLAISTIARVTSELVVPGGGSVRDVMPIFGGRLLALMMRDGAADTVVVLTANGQLVHRIQLPVTTWHACAGEKGLLLLGSGDAEVVAIDLRYGRALACGTAPHPVSEGAIDDDGRSVALAGPVEGEVPIVTLMRADELLHATSRAVACADTQSDEPASSPPPIAVPHEPPPAVVGVATDQPRLNATEPAQAVTIPDLLPLALGSPRVVRIATSSALAAPFADTAEHLGALLDLIAARAALAIAEGWHTGRLSGDPVDAHPFQREVLALAGVGGGHAADELVAARARLIERSRDVAARVAATLAAGIELPFVELAHELALSPVATQVLLAVLAPAARPEIGRLYRILVNETSQVDCDEAVLARLLAGSDHRAIVELGAELAETSALVRHGAIVRLPRHGLVVEPALVARLRGQRVSPGRLADRALEQLFVDRRALRTLVLELAEPREAIRVVIRGKRGSGRHSVIAALALRIDRRIVCIDAADLPRGVERAPALRRELARAHLTRAIPVISGLELREGSDLEATRVVHQVLRDHAGPLVIRTSHDATVPLDPGFVDVALLALTETERRLAFATALASWDVAADLDVLAARHRLGPGTAERVACEARRRIDRTGGESTQIVDEVARQYVAARIGSGAQRVTRLATWDQVSLPDDMLDSLRELIGRARHGRTVFDDWGYDARIATARGLTALFYGPPGTGKTMVAGLIARELGLDLYRVDLAKVISKWVGETEKNLGEVFDAAEDGRLMLLFDEADSLFTKRSEVKSANDRYANLEVNYLLQRLDAFEGVAVLTTNLEGSIDPAFRRRLSMRLYFPFPDEELRAQLWAAHVTPQVPTVGRLDFAALARRFPLSGGYIRNSALRAAFLAAQEHAPLSQAHLERAVLLEYRELGKLADDGRLD